MIAFIGSVFSPWYRWSGRKEPQNHCCINLVTTGREGRFTMTDRGRSALRQTRDTFEVGPSKVHWTGTELVIDVDEWGALPKLGKLKGRIVLTPESVTNAEVKLTPDAGHTWRPFAPMAKVEVNLAPGHSWTGHGYFDANFGTRALEEDFAFWTWGRFPLRDRTVCFYDAVRLDGTKVALAVQSDHAGVVREIETPPPLVKMKRTPWFVRRETRCDPGATPKGVFSLLEAPFYSRALMETTIDGEVSVGMHEALDLVRFRQPVIKPMLAVRVPRRAGWKFKD
ncbi:hydroxyneurosporene synthase [Rhodobacter aestuarii]|uniref:Hydroxyneurosporene synthase n=1 Tax=Rhodobacter aestuarii TaxID=453582 RepID=A0A1N7MK97_9RHOB|nr:carotenoid 1,2-hydratase [Rhodobacter aestuarii]PTV96701.1 hydroxyneurosporene synthase [Rhodobacter aestuarii]SIS86507.1 hydroxyneurosporene synthase [Rhodobacter aestuarii]